MTGLTKEEIKEAAKEAAKEGMKEGLKEFMVDKELHRKHHHLWQKELDDREMRKKRCNRIKDQITGSGVLAALGAIVAMLGYAATQWIKALTRNGT